MNKKIIVPILAVALSWLPLRAAMTGEQTDSVISIVTAINESGTITVRQPASLDSVVARKVMPVAAESSDNGISGQQHSGVVASRTGYRVQVFDDNNPRSAASQAKARQAQMELAFPSMKTYISFNSPYWRVKVGDFRTRAEAEAAADEIRAAFPYLSGYLRIVRDKINIYD